MNEIAKKSGPYVDMITYNIAYYEAFTKYLVLYHKNQEMSSYTVKLRAERLHSLVELLVPDIFAIQEVGSTWWPYLITDENSLVNKHGYGWSGNLSTLGQTDGNVLRYNDLYNLLLWRKDRFDEIESGVFRLSPMVETDMNNNRLCTYAILKSKETGIETLYASCHLCVRPTPEAQELSVNQAKTLTETLVALAKGRTVVVGGDFNANSQTPAYKQVTETAKFLDTRETANKKYNLNMCTARCWGREQNWNNGKGSPIDHIFYYGNTVVADEWRVLTDTYSLDGKISLDPAMVGINYDLSDHMAVHVRFKEIVEQSEN